MLLLLQVLQQAEVKGLGQVDQLITAAKERLHSLSPVKDKPQSDVTSDALDSSHRASWRHSRFRSPSAHPPLVTVQFSHATTVPVTSSSQLQTPVDVMPISQPITDKNKLPLSESDVEKQKPDIQRVGANDAVEVGKPEEAEDVKSNEMTGEDIRKAWPEEEVTQPKKRRGRSHSPSLRVKEIWESLISDELKTPSPPAEQHSAEMIEEKMKPSSKTESETKVAKTKAKDKDKPVLDEDESVPRPPLARRGSESETESSRKQQDETRTPKQRFYSKNIDEFSRKLIRNSIFVFAYIILVPDRQLAMG